MARWIEPRVWTPKVLEGTVIYRREVFDGDAFFLSFSPVKGDGVKIRLLGLDAPERGQPFYREAKRKLQDYAYHGGRLVIEARGEDVYGRVLGYAFALQKRGRFDINRNLVKLGMAWACGSDFKAEEEYARQHRIGLWRDPAPVPPWTYRKTNPECLAGSRYYPGRPCSPPPGGVARTPPARGEGR